MLRDRPEALRAVAPTHMLPRSAPSASKPHATTAILAVWVSWKASERASAQTGGETECDMLRRQLAPIGVQLQHSLFSLQLFNRESGLWRCGFAYVGRQPDRDDHQLALLRRISAVAPWLRVERLEQVRFYADEKAPENPTARAASA